MNYLRDNRLAAGRRQKKIKAIIFFAILFLLVILIRQPIFDFFSSVTQSLGLPIWSVTNKVQDELAGVLRTKQSLLDENQRLNDELMAGIAEAADRKVLLDENLELKNILDRRAGKNLTLAAILAKPNKSPYDTLVVDLGAVDDIVVGHRVFAYGNILIGAVAQVYANTSLIKLYSTPGETVDVILGGSHAYMQAV